MQQKSGRLGLVLILITLLVVYVGTYLAFTEKTYLATPTGTYQARNCPNQVTALIYRPLIYLEGIGIGEEIRPISIH